MKNISVIICSRNGSINKGLSENIESTIGVAYELIVIDNSENQYSIFEAYNLGMEKSEGDLVCFLHEDVIIHTSRWGDILMKLFYSNPEIGLLGIAGGKLKTKMPSGWWDGGDNVFNVIQHFQEKPKERWVSGFKKSAYEEVATIDGVFMVMRNNKILPFNEELIGFHNYDLFLAIKHHRLNKKVIVTKEILVEHMSIGNLDKEWYELTSSFHKRYKKDLPIVKQNASKLKNLKEIEQTAGYNFIIKLIEKKLFLDAWYWWWQLVKLKPPTRLHIKILKKIINKNP